MCIDSLCSGVKGVNLVEFSLIVKGHHFYVVLGRVLDVGRLLARVGVDDTRIWHLKFHYLLYLTLLTVNIVIKICIVKHMNKENKSNNYCRLIVVNCR